MHREQDPKDLRKGRILHYLGDERGLHMWYLARYERQRPQKPSGLEGGIQ